MIRIRVQSQTIDRNQCMLIVTIGEHYSSTLFIPWDTAGDLAADLSRLYNEWREGQNAAR